jgi:hypothetical protein
LDDTSAATLAAACSEASAAVDDFWPFVDFLSAGRLLPLPIARAWGQVPLVVDAAHDSCPSVETYASVVPAPQRSIQDGAAADMLANVQRERGQLTSANAQLRDAWSELQAVDLGALNREPRLARLARAVGLARDRQADVADTLAFTAPDRLEALLGGSRPRSIVLSVIDEAPGTQAYLVLDQGRVVAVGVGEPPASPSAIVSVNQAGLQSLQSVLSHASISSGASGAEVAAALLTEFARVPFADEQNAATVLQRAAEDHTAWLWFDDSSMQAMVARRGWIRQ